MVSKVEEAKSKGNHNKDWQQQSSPESQCNKGKTSKFKRSSSNLEEDGASSAILLLACIACTPSY
ncbi:MADS-box protein CMB1 [Hibiscus syriacus]|uniref:MADS-box protein CMB1 n=1 Tax=Hibiscus syriacus TaxID=106335 RepID=A0A6A2WGW4_HIBSY|nr:MADS-box protein CMB1 [Hibiscus syriacus]